MELPEVGAIVRAFVKAGYDGEGVVRMVEVFGIVTVVHAEGKLVYIEAVRQHSEPKVSIQSVEAHAEDISIWEQLIPIGEAKAHGYDPGTRVNTGPRRSGS